MRMVFGYPDTYEIAMSNLGLQIIYELVNNMEGLLLERVFAPWVDMEEKMRERNVPLFSLESWRPVKDFDLIGFTLQYELNYTNVLNMLDLSGMDVRSELRDHLDPLVVAGGPCAFNPEPLAPFIDCFVIGDAEEALPEILERLKTHKAKRRGTLNKAQFLQEAADISGVYVPAFYSFKYKRDGTVLQKEVQPPAPPQVTKRVIKNLGEAFSPTKPIVPNIEVVHDRIMLEVARGCTRGCRFCQAGVIYRPVRERDVGRLVETGKSLVEATGHGEVSLVSLNTADYSQVLQLAKQMTEDFSCRRVSLSLPSLRVDRFSVDLAREVHKVRRSTLTFAPEAGTQRLRDVINKGVREEDLFSAAAAAFAAGWDQLKLYFMIGLPTETTADLEGIGSLVDEVLRIGREVRGNRRVKVTVSTSSFVPKPHTPFQWSAQDTVQTLKEKQQHLKRVLRKPGVVYNWHDPNQSFIEAIISRGGRDTGNLLQTAWEKGCRFDSWSEHFQFGLWEEAISELGYDAHLHINRGLFLNATLAWDHINTGIKKRFLIGEYRRALEEQTLPTCRFFSCSQCGVCSELGVTKEVSGQSNARSF